MSIDAAKPNVLVLPKESEGLEVLRVAGFADMPVLFLRHAGELGLDAVDQALVVQVTGFQYGRNRPFPSNDTLAALLRLSKRTVQRRLRRLQRNGLLWLTPGTTPSGVAGANLIDLTPLWQAVADVAIRQGTLSREGRKGHLRHLRRQRKGLARASDVMGGMTPVSQGDDTSVTPITSIQPLLRESVETSDSPNRLLAKDLLNVVKRFEHYLGRETSPGEREALGSLVGECGSYSVGLAVRRVGRGLASKTDPVRYLGVVLERGRLGPTILGSDVEIGKLSSVPAGMVASPRGRALAIIGFWVTHWRKSGLSPADVARMATEHLTKHDPELSAEEISAIVNEVCHPVVEVPRGFTENAP